ncbi:MAG TPA: hypothetical protein VKA15_11845, partial [Isosphaeraceae bacterium]|nr:hypothetical protein [Isosphaeraceae bacterium]
MALDFVKKAGHFANHAVNSVRSDTIVSWNHVVFVLGGPPIDLTAKTILVGNAVWAGLLLARAAPGRAWRVWSLPFLLATAAVGSILCAQAHNYDIVLFILIVPYLLWLWDRRYMFDVAILAVMLMMASVPRSLAVFMNHRAGFSQGLSEVMLSYKAFATVALAMYLLVRGQPVPGVPESESDQDRAEGGASVRFGTTDVST